MIFLPSLLSALLSLWQISKRIIHFIPSSIYTTLLLWGGSFLLNTSMLYAQETAKVAISSIQIKGNKKTQPAIILRELDFSIGDSMLITDLKPRIEINQQNIQNTGLFVTTEIKISGWNTVDSNIDLIIDVHELWYIYPYVIFELADRNFNVWWIEQRRSLQRVNYGMSLNHLNLTGRRDRAKITLQGGYTQKYELDYNLPGINKKQTIGVFGNLYYIRRKEMAYITDANKLLFYDYNDEYQLKRLRISAGISLRPQIYQYHTFKLQWSDNEIGGAVASDLNPEYFLNNTTRQRHLTFWYQFAYDKRDFKPYPLSGTLFTADIQRDGFGVSDDVNALSMTLKGARYFLFGKKKKFSTEVLGKIRTHLLRHKQPYTHTISMGYEEDVLRGYELYVIDGMDMGMLKMSLRYQLFDYTLDFGQFMPIHAFKVFPLRAFFLLHNDMGYVNSIHYTHYGNLHNQLLWSGGVGLDIVMYHDKIFRIQYSINHLREKGLFLHFLFST